MKILLLGKNGQLGWTLQRALAPLGEVIAVDRKQADLAEPAQLRALIGKLSPDWIVNAAAYTAVDAAESDAANAYKINAEALAILAEEARRLDAWLVHYSTDYVYDGRKKTPYLETDEVNPLSVYGASKLAGEEHIRNAGCKYLNFRTSWVYAARGHNFAKTMLRLASEREQLNIIADQFGAPTSAELIADVTALIIAQLNQDKSRAADKAGTYHLVAAGEACWHSYAQHVVNKAIELGCPLRLTAAAIHPIKTEEYPLPATRPGNSRLCIEKIEQTFALKLPHWSFHLERMLQQIHQE